MSEPEYDLITGEPVSGTPDEVKADKRKVIVGTNDDSHLVPDNSSDGTYDIITGEKLTEEEIRKNDEEAAKEASAPKVEDHDPLTGESYDKKPSHEEKGGAFSALKGMVSFFTVIRIPVDMKEFDAMERNFWLSPVVGLLVGLVAFVTCTALDLLHFSMLAQGVFALAAAYMFSKFIHFDGLTDFGDGMICSSGDREKHIKALKDTLVGAGGVGVAIVTIVMTVILYPEAASHLSEHISNHSAFASLVGFIALACEVLVKNAQVAAASFGLPGNGMASRQVSCTTMGSLVKSTLLTFVLLVVWTYAVGMIMVNSDFRLYILPFAWLIASIVTGWWMARTANRNFGFVNGDILGATNEISRVVLLIVTVLVMV